MQDSRRTPLDINVLMGDLVHAEEHPDAPHATRTRVMPIREAIRDDGDSDSESTPSESRYDLPPVAPAQPSPAEDAINPAHYRKHPSGIECIEVTRHLNFNIGNAIKYLWRYLDKGDPVENLKKAQWYIDDEIRRLQGLR